MNARLRITFVLTLGLLTFVGTLLAMGPHSQDTALQTSAPSAPQATLEPYLVKDIYSGTGSSNPNLACAGGTLFVHADDGVRGRELWKSDGTTAGTVLIKDIWPGSNSSYVAPRTDVSGTLFFSANDGQTGIELWKSDGTPTGTVLVKDINSGSANSALWHIRNVNGKLFFSATDGSHGRELWTSDGTPTGTVMVKDINPAGDSMSLAELYFSTSNIDNTFFFPATDGSHGFELWKSDGTPTGTVMVKDINPVGGSDATALVNMGGTLYFSANDGSGRSLWKSDGTPTGTVMVEGTGGMNPVNLINVMEGTLYFFSGSSLWKSDGTLTGTVLVQNVGPCPVSQATTNLYVTNMHGTLVFCGDDGANGRELWKSDGTPTGTVMIKDIWSGNNSSWPKSFANVNGTPFFSADDGSHGAELWTSDGTPTGTIMVKDINAGSGSSSLIYMTNLNNTLFFSADDGTHGVELWALTVPLDLPYKVYLPVVMRN